MVFVGFGESFEAESVSDDKGIDLFDLIFIGVGFFEVLDELWVELIRSRGEREPESDSKPRGRPDEDRGRRWLLWRF